MPRRLLLSTLGFLGLLSLLQSALADARVALVIGNGAYRNVAVLPNPQNDASAIAASFERLGFVVTTLRDAGFDDMRRALIAFGERARGADMAVVFFAGHGIEIGGENWLIPIDAELKSDTDAENEAIGLRSVMLQVSSTTTLGLVILDACRNNPFAARMQRSVRVRAVERGLARIEPADNVLIAYAAKDGTTASDGDGRHSPFTAALLRNLETPGLEISFMFRSVRDDVMTATNREQQPFVYGSLSKAAIYLKPPASGAVSPGPEAAGSPDKAPSGDAAVSSQQRVPAVGSAPTMTTDAVEADAVGRWQLAIRSRHGIARWYWEIAPDGSYRFHGEGKPGAPAHAGAVGFGGGRWTLRATSGLPGYKDGGTYEFRGRDTFVVTGRLGTGVWRRVDPTESGVQSTRDGAPRGRH